MSLDKGIANKILTIGCEYRHPKGGVAQVMHNYEQYVFPVFKCVVNSGGTNKLQKLFKAVTGWCNMAYKLCTDRRIKIVHIHTASYNSFKRSAYFVQLAKAFGKKVVLHIHGGGFKEYYATAPKWITSVLNRSDTIIVLSESWKDFFQRITAGPKIRIVENIVARPSGGSHLWNDDKCHLLFLGKVCKEKGIFDLLDVLRVHKAEFKNKVVLHIGGGGAIDQLIKKISAYGLIDIAVYEGFVSGIRKIDLLYSSSAFILPSYTEGLPVSILESMSFGKPVLSTPIGGIPEVVKHGENGLLFQPGDKDTMYFAIARLQDDANLRKSMGEKSASIIEPYFPENVGQKLEKIYRELL